VYEASGADFIIEGVPDHGTQIDHPFLVALMLNKSLQYGRSVADRLWKRAFKDELVSREYESNDYDAFMGALNDRLNWPFEFDDYALQQAADRFFSDTLNDDEVELWRLRLPELAVYRGARYLDESQY
jgi:hypothetical protein